ncbi:MAG: hypothetical protein QG635_536, partial [Bacteroidota bacterium]|nr:hypothetical protein [Bacteroidota bacterium]
TLSNEKGEIIAWNMANEEYFKIKSSDAIGKYFWDIQYGIIPESKSSFKNYEILIGFCRKIYTNGIVPDEFKMLEFEIASDSIDKHYLQQKIFSIPTDIGYMIASVARDITEIKKAQLALLREKEKAEEANRVKSIILSNISHELRTPLTGIIGFTKMLAGAFLDAEDNEIADMIIKSGYRLMNTLNSLLTMSEIEAGMKKVNIETVHLQSLVQTALTTFSKELEEKKLKISLSLADDNCYALADEDLANQILFQLIDNAIKFTNEGGIEIHLNLHDSDNDKWASIEISDTGIGIHPDNFYKVFEAFRQVDEGIARKYEGIGLGLTLAKKMIELMGGKIEMQSEIFKGTTFVLYFKRIPDRLFGR